MRTVLVLRNERRPRPAREARRRPAAAALFPPVSWLRPWVPERRQRPTTKRAAANTATSDTRDTSEQKRKHGAMYAWIGRAVCGHSIMAAAISNRPVPDSILQLCFLHLSYAAATRRVRCPCPQECWRTAQTRNCIS